jgi:antitoxin component YwqK of YwqJK toxin-antitoxin module
MNNKYFNKHSNQLLLFISLLNIVNQSYGQSNIQTEEIRINYTNATEVFNVAKNNPKIEFDDKKEYFWYTDFSKIKSTKGGSGGQLLHGNYKLYDEEGNLSAEKNFKLGLKDGLFKDWDSTGNVVQTHKYSEDVVIYWKFLDEDGLWIEHDGIILQEGWTKKVFTKWGTLIEETKKVDNYFRFHSKTYYEFSGNIKEEFTSGGEGLFGAYTSYYDNGKIEVQGEYCIDSPIEIRTGKWKLYESDGTLEDEVEYKAEVEKFENEEFKHAGGYIFDKDINDWVKHGEWRWYNESGEWKSSKKYEWGYEIEVEE